MRPVSAGNGVLAVRVDPSKRALAVRTAAELAEMLAPALGHPLRIDVLDDVAPDGSSGVRAGDEASVSDDAPSGDHGNVGTRLDWAGKDGVDPAQHPLVQNVVAVFGAKIVDITRKPPA